MTTQLALDLHDWRLRERVSPQARRIRIEIRGADEVLLVIPQRGSRRAAHAFLQSRMPWIRRKLHEQRLRAAAQAPAHRRLQWDGSDRLMLRGRACVLVAAAGRSPRVDLGDPVVVVAPAARLADRRWLDRKLLAALRLAARSDAQAMIDQEAARLGVQAAGLRIADQKSLWGSCSPQGRISLNWRLVMAPPQVLRYVVVHELAHRVHLDHSARFWRLVEQQMPQFQEPRRWLRQHGAGLHKLFSAGFQE